MNKYHKISWPFLIYYYSYFWQPGIWLQGSLAYNPSSRCGPTVGQDCFGVGPARSLWVKPWMLGADPQVFCQSWFFSNTDPFLHRGIIILSLARHAGLVFLSAANWLWQHTSWCHTGTQVESSWCPKWSLGTSLSWSWVRGRMEWKIVQAHLWTKAVQNNRKN